MEESRKTLMADPEFRRNYEDLKEKTIAELEILATSGNKFNPENREAEPLAVVKVAQFLIYERKVNDGTWPDKTPISML